MLNPACWHLCAQGLVFGMQVWLQEFCWSYKSTQAKLRLRNQSAPDNHELVAAPMFCFEVNHKNLIVSQAQMCVHHIDLQGLACCEHQIIFLFQCMASRPGPRMAIAVLLRSP